VQVLPAIDLLGESATRLEQGDYERPLFAVPAPALVARAARLRPPFIHLVDLEAARSGALRPDILRACLTAAGDVPVQVAGGIRTVSDAQSVLALGASRVVVGTAAFARPEGPRTLAEVLGPRLVVALDVASGELRVRGWLASASWSVEGALAECVTAGVTRVAVTAIDRDGTMAGPDLALMASACRHALAVQAAGGVRDQSDVQALEVVGCEAAIVGRAFAESTDSADSSWLRT
jgi:phosphoribosylformimino-5-aminoimidazole carboxamide ribotide isomerase